MSCDGKDDFSLLLCGKYFQTTLIYLSLVNSQILHFYNLDHDELWPLVMKLWLSIHTMYDSNTSGMSGRFRYYILDILQCQNLSHFNPTNVALLLCFKD